ncbi:H-NS family nucleoid-associated regulatory protein [Thiomicrorhabdus xiamenensis]|uniref:DNA-binding protein n=1 Tax=Thiomicrorhabdus xiamenensis TaxID=2739063 RepID=A0A7D4NYB9_9GAMM|nr:H-NS histone family protein [Thiomicrorhabdus xiamenensis]QKI89078.1 H-NS histone family protein [Thiomicrorhabdus xiamenensis]
MDSNEFVKIALHRKRLRAAIKSLGLNDLQKLASDINELLAEREQEIEQQKAEQQQKLAKIEEMKSLLNAQGLSIEDLMDMDTVETTTKKPATRTVEPKYRILDENGQEHLWTGRGRAPKVFQKYFDQGNSKESCLIK